MNFNMKNLVRVVVGGYLIYTGWQLYAGITENRPTNFTLMMVFSILFVFVGVALIVNFFFGLYKQYRTTHPKAERVQEKDIDDLRNQSTASTSNRPNRTKQKKSDNLNTRDKVGEPSSQTVQEESHDRVPVLESDASTDKHKEGTRSSMVEQKNVHSESERNTKSSPIIDLRNPGEALIPEKPSETRADVSNDITKDIKVDVTKRQVHDVLGDTQDLTMSKPKESAFDIITKGIDDSFGNDIELNTQEMQLLGLDEEDDF